ncbi:hypothetical protein G6F57_009018 [Rhizopus arrhizus]|uniref:Uncharacterized protein n=1 Tax=Rhizopus oryzae TaxID=64495 RepID=A0A9P7BRT2_RHIOR|nr:hypothetical protein G6F23_004195 [Rhizopus arrhizus]KAG1417122.1 hypothetical protein G6F58_005651 [Rhizopus delemar]KAG0759622.1 hypothetical protein G6F24_008930 [Rhizopus arrhizus]KAG0777399.1 hypothetical protein G6F22_011897 [Rhizopus arrhizus]KAG0791362.1 hypothetical protein G6F21_005133 [Rhizopus arrhizus]
MAASMMKMITEHEDVSQILTCTYTLLLSGTLLVTEIKSFHIILDLFKLALTHKGKSLILILLGSVVISNKHTFLLVTGILNLLIGLLYWIISFLPSCPCPKSATESWQNWQEYSAEGMDLDKPDTGVDNATRLKLSMIDKPLKAKLDP